MPYKDPVKQKESSHKSYLKNKIIVSERSRQTRLKWRKIISDLKRGPCLDCGNTFLPCSMDFDHREGVKKVASINYLIVNKGLSEALEEIKKCDLVCANCHRVRTWSRIHKKLKSLC